MADFLLDLADFDAGKLWRELGHTALRQGRLCLSTIIEVAKVLSPENRHAVLPRFFGLSRREAEMLAASRDARQRPSGAARPRTAALARLGRTARRRGLAVPRDRHPHTPREAREGLAKAMKRKGLVEKPRKEPPPSQSDAVPAHVKREVWRRAGGRCEFRFDSGEVCGSTHRLELDPHPVPKAHGGPATIDNIRLACEAHNKLAARRIFGDACMDRYMRRDLLTGGRPDAVPP